MEHNSQEFSMTDEPVRAKSSHRSKSWRSSALNRAEHWTSELQTQPVHILPQSTSWKKGENMRMLQEQCRYFCLATFFRKYDPIHCLGITSSIAGEGKSLLSISIAQALAHDSTNQVTLLECNWDRKSLHHYFTLPKGPGLAEWLRKECQEETIRHCISDNLTVIPAGEGKQNAVELLQHLQQQGIQKIQGNANDFLIVDLPSIVSTAYGSLAASLVEALVIVVRAGVTSASLLEETGIRLKGVPIEGLILNQVQSKIPQWLRHII